ncbi:MULTISPECIES: transporter substrate-binding domain-containing protein [unclassified Clostridium]|uniref:transporter substrate-binding domain-containing protein n=1 Tax=unclassified Clostridium TaxID=2614128 RepID=UPI00290D73A6|nr:transporter substrate-binding domain-containing protein [Clostridium sp.]MDU5107036.1 transporter substrate-binding domain-containing protein [Clostridium sp.]
MKKKLSLLILAVATAALTLTGCGSSNANNSGEDVFRVGMEAGYAPFNWTQMDDSNGAVKIDGSSEYAGGYDVEIAKKIADSLGKKLVIVKTEWDGLVPALTSGKIDAIIAGMSPTAERKETIDFTDVYYKSDLVMLVKKGSSYENAETLKDFSGAKVTAQLNTFHYTVIDQIPSVNKVTAMDNFPAMRVALESGVIDGYVTERPEALSAQMANENFKMVEFKEGFVTSEEDTAIAVGLQKNSDLKDKINETLKGISEEDRLKIMDDAIKNQPAAQ